MYPLKVIYPSKVCVKLNLKNKNFIVIHPDKFLRARVMTKISRKILPPDTAKIGTLEHIVKFITIGNCAIQR